MWGKSQTLQCAFPPKEALPALENGGIGTLASTLPPPILVELAKTVIHWASLEFKLYENLK